MTSMNFVTHALGEQTTYQTRVLRRMREPGLQKLCDVTISIGEHRVAAHRAILSGASEVLASLLASEWSNGPKGEVSLNFITAPAFTCVLEFIYTGKLSVSTEKLLEAHSAAKLLLIEPLQRKLRSIIIKQISVGTVFAVGEHAWLFDDQEMQEHCEQFVSEHFEQISLSQRFRELSFDCVRHFVSSNDLVLADGEVSVLKAVTNWAGYSPRERAEQFAELLHLIRFSDMAKEELAAIVEVSGSENEVALLAAAALADAQAEKHIVEEEEEDSEADQLAQHDGSTVVQVAGVQRPGPTLIRNTSRGRNYRSSEGASTDAGERGGPRFRVPRRCVRNIRFDMVVRNFSQLGGSSQAINSPWYKCGGGLLWRLEVYPCGSAPGLSEYMSVFLRCADESTMETFECSANFSLFIVEQNFGGHERIFEATKNFTTDEPCWGRSKYVRRADFLEYDTPLRDERGNVIIGTSITW